MINTTRQLGGVIGSAAVGALLQAQLSAELKNAAVANTNKLPAEVPAQLKDGIVNGFAHASGDLQVGAGQNGISPQGIPEQFKSLVNGLVKTIFDEGFTQAMRTTLWLPIVVMGIAALSILLVRRRRATPTGEPAADQADAVPVSH
jgi:hypothetical protein